ncbi:MAG: shikimate kinase [Chitinispirillia bacterium]|nr:shikimate kinase [Chitinispirillia bacterium]MCL2268199.1 shikimate kinase [Chitinispirillia bacterium]
MNIILIGFASSGKTTAAGAICSRTGRLHIDLDRTIEGRYERKYGRRASVREIFTDTGMEGWSELENDALRSLSNMRNSVLSTGGRTPLNEENRVILKSLGTIVYLKCEVGAVLQRMKRKGIPASIGTTPEEVEAEWTVRDPIYAALADMVIENEKLTPADTARAILERMPMPT